MCLMVNVWLMLLWNIVMNSGETECEMMLWRFDEMRAVDVLMKSCGLMCRNERG